MHEVNSPGEQSIGMIHVSRGKSLENISNFNTIILPVTHSMTTPKLYSGATIHQYFTLEVIPKESGLMSTDLLCS